ncbi:hypothetical protein UlMin_000465 [Ulmus minor]
METSLRYGGDSKVLRIHAEEKLPIDYDTLLQLDTRVGAPSYFCVLLRHFYPDNSKSYGEIGLKYDKREKLCYIVPGKKSFPVTTNSHFSFNIKGNCDVDKKFKQKEQDVRLKIGYEVPYFHIRENNWTFNANGNGRWNVRFDL